MGFRRKLLLNSLLKKYSDIVITAADIEEKTREGSNVKSFRISVKADYLEKTLQPETWPFSVKVREWVYFPRKRDSNSEGGRIGQRGPHSQVASNNNSLYKHRTSEGTPAAAPVTGSTDGVPTEK